MNCLEISLAAFLGHHELDGPPAQGSQLITQGAPGSKSGWRRLGKADEELHRLARARTAHELEVLDTPTITNYVQRG